MASSFRVRITGRPLTDTEFTTPGLMRRVGEGVMTRIRSRTTRGVDSSGRAFKPLSVLYAVQKRKAIGHSRSDLTVSGRMLNDMVIKPGPTRVSITFKSAGGTSSGRTLIQRSRSIGGADKAFWHNVSGAGRARVVREFFDLNDSDESFVVDLLTRHLEVG